MPDKDKTTKQIVMDWVSQGVFDVLGDAVSIQDTDFKVLYQNQSHKKMIGEHTGEYCYKAYQRKDNLCGNCHLAMSFKDGKVHKMEQVRDTDAGIFYYEIISSPLKDNAGKIIAGMEVVKDISKRKQAEKALATSEEKYRLLVNALQEGIWALDTEENTTFVNDRMAEMLGYTAEEMLGKKVFDFMDEQGVKLCKEKLEKRKAGIKEQHDFELIKKDGNILYVTMEASPIKDEDGNYIGGVAGVIDITERKKIELSLLESEEKFKAFFYNSPDAIFIADNNGIISDANPAASRLLSRPHEEIVGMNQSELHPPRYEKASKEKFSEHKKAIRTIKDVEPIEHVVMRSDGSEVPVHIRASKIKIKDRNMIMGVFRDISDRVQIETKLVEREKQLIESQKVALIGSWDWDVVNNRLTWSDELFNLFGVSPRKFQPSYEAFLSMVHPDDRALLDGEVKKAVRDKSPYHIDVRIINPDGREWVMEARGIITCDDSGNTIRLGGTAQDISERNAAERIIKRLADSWQKTFDAIPGPVFFRNADGVITQCNIATERLVGKPISEIIGRKCWEIIHGTSGPIPECPIPAMNKSLLRQSVVLPAGDRFFQVYVDPVMDEAGNLLGVVHTMEDITKRKNAEEGLKKYREYLEKLVKERTDELEKQKSSLEDKNVALREVIGQIELEKCKIKENISSNIEELIIPILRKAKAKGTGEKHIELIEQNLKKITSSFGITVSSKKLKLTPREIDVCNMIEKGLTNKEMSDLLNISIQSIEGYRKNIRKKLGLSNKKVNLSNYLRSLR
jgi:PAS domain S-box-containing protein